MALIATLVETTPQRLLYLIRQTNYASFPSTSLVIPNVNGATPDLGTDSLRETPMGDVCDYSRIHGLVLNQAQARALLLGDNALGAAALLGGGTGPDADFNAPRCHCHFTPRAIAAGWGVDGSFHAVTGEPELTLFGPVDEGAEAYLEILYSYSAAT
jgi:hypothetical protein